MAERLVKISSSTPLVILQTAAKYAGLDETGHANLVYADKLSDREKETLAGVIRKRGFVNARVTGPKNGPTFTSLVRA